MPLFLQEYLFAYPILLLLQSGFTLWMLVDAHRRGMQYWWFWIIFAFQPLGPWFYFFAEKWHDLSLPAPVAKLLEKKTPIEELQFRAQQSPTVANNLALGERLIELGHFEEAIAPLEEARKREPEMGPVCYKLARCHHELGRPQQAAPLLAQLVARDPRHDDYAAWKLLMEVQEALGQESDVLETARQLVKMSPRMEHKYLLAEQLARHHQDGEARLVLENALQEQQFVSGPVRRLNRKWVKQAQKLLKELNP